MKTIDRISLPTDCPILDWIDRELVDTYESFYTPTNACNILLEIRHHFSCPESYSSLNRLIGGFYHFLPQLESDNYLLGYRIRQWISFNYNLQISDPLDRVESELTPICQTMRSIDHIRKAYFEKYHYSIPFHDIRIKIIARASASAA